MTSSSPWRPATTAASGALSRRQLLATTGAGALALAAAGCDGGGSSAAARTSTPPPSKPEATMTRFADPLQDGFASWALGYISANGADIGELDAIAAGMSGTDDSAFYELWMTPARRHLDAGRAASADDRRSTARHHLLRASVCAGVAYHMFFGKPVDPRLVDAFDLQMDAFAGAMALLDPPAEALTIPFDGHPMMAWFLPAQGSSPGERRPLVIVTNGYDGTISDLYFAMGVYTTARGYHCLIFDGPGQGAMLVREGVTMVADWAPVVAAVMDVAIDRPDVDPGRIALQGWSLGGYLALRAASGEHRLAACIADPPVWDVLSGMRPRATSFGVAPEAAARFPESSDADQQLVTAGIESDRQRRWSIIDRGFWVQGGTDLRSWMAAIAPYSPERHIGGVRCPVFGTAAEDDPLAKGASTVLDQIGAPTLAPFTTAEGAGSHVEMQNRALVETQALDWLDRTLR